MEKFTVSITFEANVSKDAADNLEYLVEEFIQGVVNVVGNDQLDQITALLDFPQLPAADEGSDAPISAANFDDSY